MSAVVRAVVSNGGGLPAQTVRSVEVPRANGYEIDQDGRLILRTSPWGEVVAVFQKWDHVVITPDRGPNGRFIKKGS